MKLRLSIPKPRNPLVVACLRRRAGSHRALTGSLRQRAGLELKRELGRLGPIP